MAAVLFRRGSGLCVRCIHRELCRLVWRPQTALFSSKPSDRKQPRRTHIKKAKPQPAVDVAKLLEQLFSQRRPGTTPPAGKARPAKASSVPAKPPITSSINVSPSNASPLSKTEPVSVFPAASSFTQVDADRLSNVTVPTASGSSPTSTAPSSLGPEAAAIGCQTSAETIETKVETATEPVELKTATVLNAETASFPAATVEPLIDTTIESPLEPTLSPVETLQVGAAVVEGPVEPTVDAPVEEVQTKSTDSGVADVSHTAKEEPLIETAIESPVEACNFPVEETKAAVVEGLVEPTIDATVDVAAQKVETKSTDSREVDVSHTAKEEPTIESPVEAHLFPVETLEARAAVVEGPVVPTIDVAAQKVEPKSTDSGVADVSHTAKEEPLIETTIESPVEAHHFPVETPEAIAAVVEGPAEPTVDVAVDISHTATVEHVLETTVEPSVEASTSLLETLESRAAVAECVVEPTVDAPAQAVQINSTDSDPANLSHTAEEQPLIEATIEPAVVASSSPVSEEPTIETEAADNLSHIAVIQNAPESAPLLLKNESAIESTVESVNVAVEEEVNRSEEMTLESVTLHVDKVLVASLKTDELLRTTSILDEKAEKQAQELLVQTGIGAESKAAAETESSSVDESEILTEVLSKWDSLSEDLQELEGESGTLVKELLCHVPAVLSESPDTVKTSSDPPVGANGEQTEEKATEAEAMTLESITLAKVKAEVGGLETEVLLETRNELEKEADVLAKEEKMEVTPTTEDVFEDTTAAEILTLDSISEATDAIEAETSVMLEAMFGSEQGPRQPPPDASLAGQKLMPQDEAPAPQADTESGEQQGSVLEAMSLESVTLAEVEASLGSLEEESLTEAADYLEKEAEIVAGEKRTEVKDTVASEETTEALKIESLSEGDDLSEDLQIDALMEELLFSVPGHVTAGHSGQEVVRENILDATVATGSVDVDTADVVTDDFPASPQVLLGQEEEEGAQAEALGDEEDGTGTHADLDPVQRLFLEKIKEYNNMRRLNGGLMEAEPDYEKYLSEETAKLQRLYGGGDLSSFPVFTFSEPKMDQDSK